MKKIAVIGAGMAGLNLAYYLLKKKPHLHLDIISHEDLEKSASGIATGLLSPYSGQYLTLSDQAIDAYIHTQELLENLEKKSATPLILHREVLRLGSSKRQLKAYKKRAKTCGEFIDFEELKKHFSNLKTPHFAFLHPQSIALHMPSYLQALKDVISQYPHCHWKKRELMAGEIFGKAFQDEYQVLFLAAGRGSLSLLPQDIASAYGLNLIKGQVLSFENQDLKRPLVAKRYLIPVSTRQESYLLVGASYEKDFSHLKAENTLEMQRLLHEAQELFPSLKGKQVIRWQASARLCSASHTPLWGRLKSKVYVLTALGSKGLLTHSLLAERLVDAFVNRAKPKGILGAELLWE